MSTPALPRIDPPTRLALDIASADLQYVRGAIMRPQDPSRGWLFIQWAVMTSYESQRHIQATLGKQRVPAWDPDMAKAARMAGKFFDDKKRTIEELAAYFNRLNTANRGAFFLPDRPLGRLFDFWRTDLGVLLYNDVPVTTSISGYYAAGVSPDQLISSSALGPRMSELTEHVGRTFRQLDAEETHDGPHLFEPSRFTWRDLDTAKLSDVVFEGMFDTAMALAMLTVQGAVRAARHLSRSTCCDVCRLAALKHRFVVTYQGLTSLRRLRSGSTLPTSAHTLVDAVLESPECAHMLSDGYRRLRNGWLHLGLSDVPYGGDTLDFARVVRHYTGGEATAEVAAVTETAIGVLGGALDRWCMTPKDPSKRLSSILKNPDSL